MRALVALLAALTAGCGLANLIHLPGDLAAATRATGPHATRSTSPAPVEAALYRAADAAGRPELIRDTRDPGDDAKLAARRCDAGAPEACARVAVLFMYSLGEPQLALELWEGACSAGSTRACRWAADEYATRLRPHTDLIRAHRLYRAACDGDPPDAWSCFRALYAPIDSEERRRRITPEARPDIAFDYLDRSCELGLRPACSRLPEFLSGPLGSGPSAPLLRDYYAALLRVAGMAPGPFYTHTAETLREARALRRRIDDWTAFGAIEGEKAKLRDWVRQRVFLRLASAALGEYAPRRAALRWRTPPSEGYALAAAQRSSDPAYRRVEGRCADCLDRCPDGPASSPRENAEAKACLCRCMSERGDCGVLEDSLVRCLAGNAARLEKLE